MTEQFQEKSNVREKKRGFKFGAAPSRSRLDEFIEMSVWSVLYNNFGHLSKVQKFNSSANGCALKAQTAA